MQGVNRMNIEHGEDFISLYHNVFPKSNCDAIIEKFEHLNDAVMHSPSLNQLHEEWAHNGHFKGPMDGRQQFGDRSAGRMDTAFNLAHIDDYCNSTSYDADVRKHGCNCNASLICDYIYKATEDYINTYGTLRRKRFYSLNNKVQKTPAGGGYHVWHDELGETISEADRMLVWMLYLNDDFEGGETEFLYQKKRLQPSPGTIVIWPAQWTHQHRGNMVLSGNKYIITGWVHQQWNDPSIGGGKLLVPNRSMYDG